MRYNRWEKNFKRSLGFLKRNERDEAVRYYREMYEDKLDSGMLTEDILYEFGTPELCAARLYEERLDNSFPEAKKKEKREAIPRFDKGRRGFLYYLGMFFATVLFIIPLGAILLSLIVSFGAAVISGFAVSVSGVAVILCGWLPIFASGIENALFNIASGFACIGIGLLLAIAFWYPTRYVSVFSFKLMKLIYS
jgi:uncharacterized membrane protein